jgi:transglutaminase-like putative cysteine protease
MRSLVPSLVILLILLPLGVPAALADDVVEDRWAVIQMQGVKSGHMHKMVTKIQEDGVTLYESITEVEQNIKRGGVEIKVEAKVTMIETEEGKPVRYSTVAKQSGIPVEIHGRAENGKMIVVQKIMGTEQTLEVDMGEDTLGLHGLEMLIDRMGLEKGTTYTAKVFSTDLGKVVSITTVVGDKEEVELLDGKKTLTRLDSTIDLLPGVKPVAYLDDQMVSHKEVVQFGGISQATYWVPKEVALAEQTEDLPDLMIDTFIRPAQPIVHPRGVRSAKYLLKAKKGDLVPPVEDGTQKIIEKREDGSIVLHVEAPVPEGDTISIPVEDPMMAEYLEESVYLQCKDPDLVAKAKEVIGDETDAYRAAKLLEKWVYDNIDKKGLGVGFASAKEVFKDREGDCSEHGVLLAAMARAVGIPSRMALGVEYIVGIFGWHLWTEVYVGDWVPLDATLAAPFVDATHIKFADTRLESATFDESVTGMVSILGNLDVTVLEYTLGDKVVDPAKEESQPTMEGNTYTHPLLGLSFEKPEGWVFDEGKGGSLVRIVAPEGGVVITVEILAVTYDLTLEKFVEEIEKAEGSPFEKTELEVGGHKALEIVGEDRRSALTLPSDTLYIFEIRDPDEETLKAFHAMLKTVKVE